MSHHVIGRSHPLPDQLPEEHTGSHPHLVQHTYFAIAFYYKRAKYWNEGMVVNGKFHSINFVI